MFSRALETLEFSYEKSGNVLLKIVSSLALFRFFLAHGRGPNSKEIPN